MWWCSRHFLWVSASFSAQPFCGFAKQIQPESSLILGSSHLIHYQNTPLAYPERKNIRSLFPVHWTTFSRQGYCWEMANFLHLQTLLATIYTVLVCMSLLFTFNNDTYVYWYSEKNKGYKMAEEGKQTMLLRLNKQSLFSIFFFHVREGEGSAECLSWFLVRSSKQLPLTDR